MFFLSHIRERTIRFSIGPKTNFRFGISILKAKRIFAFFLRSKFNTTFWFCFKFLDETTGGGSYGQVDVGGVAEG